MMIWGHRGHRHHRAPSNYFEPAYENSLQAYREALACCQGIECDVVQSRNGTAYLVHDTLFDGGVRYALNVHLDAASQALIQDRMIYQLDDGEIAKLRLKDGQGLPRLQNVLEELSRYPGRIINLELKGPHIATVAVRTVEKAIQQGFLTPDQVIFSSFNFPALRYLRSHTGHRFRICALFSPEQEQQSPMYPNWINTEQDAFYVPFNEDNLKRADIQEIQPDFFNLAFSSLSPASLNLLERYFPQAHIILWAAGQKHPDADPSVVQALEEFSTAKKLYAVITDFPDEIQKRLSARGVKLAAA